MAILENRAAPTLVVQGGRYSRHAESRHFENVMPIQFPFGSRGPTLNRPTPISDEDLLRHYLKLSLPQFKKSDFVFWLAKLSAVSSLTDLRFLSAGQSYTLMGPAWENKFQK